MPNEREKIADKIAAKLAMLGDPEIGDMGLYLTPDRWRVVIAALRSKDREDGEREMALPPGWVAVPQAPTRAMCAEMARIVGNGDIAHFAYERALAARPALPLTTRTGDGDA